MGNERKDDPDENGGGCGDPHLKTCTHLVYISVVKMTYVLLKLTNPRCGSSHLYQPQCVMTGPLFLLPHCASLKKFLEVHSKGLYRLKGLAHVGSRCHMVSCCIISICERQRTTTINANNSNEQHFVSFFNYSKV